MTVRNHRLRSQKYWRYSLPLDNIADNHVQFERTNGVPRFGSALHRTIYLALFVQYITNRNAIGGSRCGESRCSICGPWCFPGS